MPRKRNPAKPVSKARTAYELLEEIRQIILEEPKRYDQEHWDALEEGYAKIVPDCGTVGCVAGWVSALKFPAIDKEGAARCVLGISYRQSSELFKATACGDTKPQTPKHARAGAAHIARFMKAHAKQLKAKKVR